MKSLKSNFLIFLLLFICTLAYGQVPQGINYQSVLRKSDGTVLPNQAAMLTFTIHNGVSGIDEYSETVNVTTNAYGIITHIIGMGTPQNGTFNDVTWETGTTFLVITALVNNETIDLGSNYLTSVPYALFAEKVSTDWAGTHIQNADASTQVHTDLESGAIYFKTGSDNNFVMKGPRLEFFNDNRSILIGAFAGEQISPESEFNIFIGDVAGNNVSGSNNIAIGQASLLTNENGYENIVLGNSALLNNIEGNGNTVIGNYPMGHNQAGNENIAIGNYALSYNEEGSENIAIGKTALSENHQGGDQNIAIGSAALFHNNRSNIIAIGDSTLFSNAGNSVEATANIAIGSKSMRHNLTGYQNTAVGFECMFENTIGIGNSAFGMNTLYSNTTGSNNTANGLSALYSNAEGFENTASGVRALYSNTEGSYNTASGVNALYFNTTGTYNTASGNRALYSNTLGSVNTANGNDALFSNTTGGYNTANGFGALYSNITGNHNTANGMGALIANTTGYGNTANGQAALFTNTTGWGNTANGYSASFTAENLDNTTCIGSFSGGISNDNNRVEIGNTSVSWIGGQVGWSTYSDARIKNQVKENVPGLSFVTRLRPVTYHLDIHKQNELCFRGKKEAGDWKEKYAIEQKQMTGFIAQEVEQAARDAGYDFSGVEKGRDEVGMYSVRYSEFVVPLVKAVQEQQVIIEAQAAANKKLQEEIEALKSQLNKITVGLKGAGIVVN